MAISKIVEVKARPPKVVESFWQGKFPDFPAPSGRPSEFKLISSKDLDKKFKQKNYSNDFDYHMDRSQHLSELWANKYAELLTKNPVEERITSCKMDEAELAFYRWHRTKKHSEDTLKQYRVHFDFWRECNGNHYVHSVNQSMVTRFCDKVSDMDRSTHTTFKYVSNMKSFFKWARREGWVKQVSEIEDQSKDQIKSDSVLLWTQNQKTKTRPKSLSETELITYGQALIKHPDRNIQRAFLMINEMMGRRNEVYNLKREDINILDGYVVLGRTKQNTEGDKKYLSPRMISFLSEDLKYRSPKEIWYLDNGKGQRRWNRMDSLTEQFRRVMHSCGIFGRKPLHSLRPTAISNGVKQGGNVFTIKGIAGHENLSQTESYTSQAMLEVEGKRLVEQISQTYPAEWYN
mgnify:FL=1